jgi:hypothetical protein
MLNSISLSALFLIIVICALIALLLPRLIYEIRLYKRARHDYRVARGTQHLRQLRPSLLALRSDLRALKSKLRRAEDRLIRLEVERSEALRAALVRYLVDNRLTEAQGIGPQFSARIVKGCFRGRLRDLRNAHRISGVGYARQNAIDRWVQKREAEMPRLLETSFPGKTDIEKRYEDEERSLLDTLESAERDMKVKLPIYKAGRNAIKKLRTVKFSDFRKVLKGEPEANVPNWYFEGVYPAWKPAPEWFKMLLEEYGRRFARG